MATASGDPWKRFSAHQQPRFNHQPGRTCRNHRWPQDRLPPYSWLRCAAPAPAPANTHWDQQGSSFDSHNSGSSFHCSCPEGALPLRELSDLPSIIQEEIKSIALGLLEFSLGLFPLSSLASSPSVHQDRRPAPSALTSQVSTSFCLPRGTSRPHGP